MKTDSKNSNHLHKGKSPTNRVITTIIRELVPLNRGNDICKHHYARLEFGDFWESSPNFFPARMGVVPLLGAEGPQK